jgi:NADH-quinone oxidoreductase subunit M
VVILTAGYILWAVQRVYLGPEYKGPHGEHLHDANLREKVIGTVLCVFAVVFGVFPYQFPGGRPSILKYMNATIDAQVHDLADWTREHDASERSAAALSAPPAPAQTASTTSGF